jgi:hypothetical protein
MGTGAGRSQERLRHGERATTVRSESDVRRKKGKWGQPHLGHLIYRGVHRIYPLRFLPPYNMPQQLYSEKFVRRLRRIFR